MSKAVCSAHGSSKFSRRFAQWIALLHLCVASAAAYEVEADSVGNSLYLLLLNDQPTASFDSVSLREGLPGFVSTASGRIVPASIAAQGSDLVALDFDVAPGVAAGSTGDLVLEVLGTLSGQPTAVLVRVPLTVVATAPVAQGVVGQGVPVADPGGLDTDADGVTDALEIAFGSDPQNASSLPGDPSALPALDGLGMLGLVALGMGLAGRRVLGRRGGRSA